MIGRIAIVRMGECGCGCPRPMPEFIFEIGARLYYDGVLMGKVVAVDRVGNELMVTSELVDTPPVRRPGDERFSDFMSVGKVTALMSDALSVSMVRP